MTHKGWYAIKQRNQNIYADQPVSLNIWLLKGHYTEKSIDQVQRITDD